MTRRHDGTVEEHPWVRARRRSERLRAERGDRKPLWRRMRLRRADGGIYLDRWGVAHERVGRVLLHRMQAPDPGVDLHDHPWWFVSIILWGGYTEQRTETRLAAARAASVESGLPGDYMHRGIVKRRRWGSIATMRLDECHTITSLQRDTCWTLVIGGPRRRPWGFYMPSGWITEHEYDETVRAGRRDMWNEVGT